MQTAYLVKVVVVTGYWDSAPYFQTQQLLRKTSHLHVTVVAQKRCAVLNLSRASEVQNHYLIFGERNEQFLCSAGHQHDLQA